MPNMKSFIVPTLHNCHLPPNVFHQRPRFCTTFSFYSIFFLIYFASLFLIPFKIPKSDQKLVVGEYTGCSILFLFFFYSQKRES